MDTLSTIGVIVLIFIIIRQGRRIDTLVIRQNELTADLQKLRDFLNPMKNEATVEAPKIVTKAPTTLTEIYETVKSDQVVDKKITPKPIKTELPKPDKVPTSKSAIEKFIGENLINKIGIAITVIGVAIGVKYSIDNELISPLTRIILGYVAGLALLGIGIKLKAKYDSFSAVLVSGAMAIFYFITFAAYSYYGLLPQGITFALMIVFTGFTVLAALSYNTQVIAHIGLVGAYAVPFLLSDGSGNVAGLFAFMTIVNIGIMVIAFKKYWKELYYAAFSLTWLIYLSWQLNNYEDAAHFGIALSFLPVFFLLFYALFLGYKLVQNEKFNTGDVLLMLLNSSLFYGLGFLVLNEHEGGSSYLGLFTLGNAAIHFLVSFLIYKKHLADRNLFFLISGMVLVFITLAVPVQLSGNWVTILWATEAALLFWIGRTKQVSFYEILSYPLMALSVFSIVQDWGEAYQLFYFNNSASGITPLLNVHFLTSLIFIAAFGFINFIHRKEGFSKPAFIDTYNANWLGFTLPAIFVFILYGSLRVEIASYWDQRYAESSIEMKYGGYTESTEPWEETLAVEEAIDETEAYPEDEAEIAAEAESVEDAAAYQEEESYQDIEDYQAPEVYPNDSYPSNEETYQSQDHALLDFKHLWIINYSLLFFALLGLIVLKKFKSVTTSYITLTLITLTILVFLTQGLYLLSELREKYQHAIIPDSFFLTIRYISFGLVVLSLGVSYLIVRQPDLNKKVKQYFDLGLHITVLWIASSELIHWMDLSASTQTYKLGLSILWGLYALMVIGLGIWKKRKHLRFGGIALFGITLLKLFFYDIQDLNAIAKTIAFVSLGVLLLVISFLYTKYKHLIVDEHED